MRPSSIIIVAVWLAFIVSALTQGMRLPLSPLVKQPLPTETAWLMLLFPFAFFLPAAFLQRSAKMRKTFLSRVVEARLGVGVLDNFVSRIRPVALFMVGNFILGGTGLISTHLTTQDAAAYVLSGFFLSAGLGLACAYALSAIYPPRLM